MKHTCRKLFIGVLAAGLGIFAAGCGSSEVDEEASQVLQISITPQATPTPEPAQVNPDAVVTNGTLTMVNEYLLDEGAAGTDASGDGAAAQDETGAEADTAGEDTIQEESVSE